MYDFNINKKKNQEKERKKIQLTAHGAPHVAGCQ